MTKPVSIRFQELSLDEIAAATGAVVVFVGEDGKLDRGAARVNRLARGAVARLVENAAFADLNSGDVLELAFPAGLAADGVLVVKLDRRCGHDIARKAGVNIARLKRGRPMLVLTGTHRMGDEIALGLALRCYEFTDHKTPNARPEGDVTVMGVTQPDAALDVAARAEGVFLTRDLTNAPANILTTQTFAERLLALSDLGLEVEVLDEPALEALGMRTLLAVGQGSDSPSKVVILRWNGGGDEAPFALIGKGVVFDTGGISMKPAAGMEEMTMDMGGAGVVAGVMSTLARRKAKANVVALVGLVENMPDGKAIRPGDVITTMKGDTVEIINTDAEGRMVLADVLWYAQDRFKPSGMIDLATLTGAIVIGLGHHKAGVFSNDDALCNGFLDAAKDEGEGAWRMPLDPVYEPQLKSRVADLQNVGGRPAGAVTAAQFLQRFVKAGVPWIHLDIAGVASTPSDSVYAPKGASGWGVLSIDRLIRDRYER
ncbi:leucyl aminopeptidase [Pseudoruegeria sp. SK021]|uniref:leucyl aminopeptidase n=1 Tax=Pseudoruegeria sp. SK021 TaxID=1933035 RepID=UPI000A217060|nr:leucyl aminopeptidase [Pseudoruegeria sp. SK021]OSP55418.1 leucyl aminopeptidase [Pseudoruegeria sp. SK021]